MTQNIKNKPKAEFSYYINLIWILAIASMLMVLLFFVVVKFSRLPDISELDNPKYELSTLIYDINNKEIGKYFKYNRVWTPYEELNPNIVNALVATEDIRFFSHSGIDTRSTIRALFYLGKKGGASTITQQLAKLFFTDKPANSLVRIWQKMQEWLIALELEKRYTKEEILAMYLNKFDFLYNSHGIEAAAKTYYGKPQKNLTPDEAAVLIGMLKWPSRYNPIKNSEKAEHRRNTVLYQMKRYGFLDEVAYNKYKNKKIDATNFSSEATFKGPAPYFRMELIKWVSELLENEKYRKPDGTKYNLDLDGLKIYTTLDLNYQILAEKAVNERMKELQGVFNQVWNGIDIWKYEADNKQMKIRIETLNRFVRESNRFKNLRERIMSSVTDSITDNYPEARLLDIDVERLLEQEKNNNYLDKLLDEEQITSSQVSVYNDILESSYWPVLKSKQIQLNREVKKVFTTKTKMKVFDYNDSGEKEVIMTPLDSIKYHRNFLQTGMLAIDPTNGHIKAWVGGINFKYFMYDHINTKRQVGSTFKPFIYSTAIFNKGINPCMKIADIQYSISPGDGDFKLTKTWSPGNADKFTGRNFNLFEALYESKNSVSVYLMKELGNAEIVRDFVEKFGIDKNDIPLQPSICLGSADLSVMQMAGAYSVFANSGNYNKPVFVTRIEDRNGNVIYRYVEEKQQALPENYNYIMVSLLRYAGKVAQSRLTTPVGGKSGTTNDYRDGWYMGISPRLVVGTWVGGDEQWIKFKNITYGQGSYMARPIFEKFMQYLETTPDIDYSKNVSFSVPADGMPMEINCEAYSQLDTLKKTKDPVPEEFEEE